MLPTRQESGLKAARRKGTDKASDQNVKITAKSKNSALQKHKSTDELKGLSPKNNSKLIRPKPVEPSGSTTASTPTCPTSSPIPDKDRTEFENEDTSCPAIVRESLYKLKWKEGCDPIPVNCRTKRSKCESDSPLTEQEKQAMLTLITTSVDFRAMCKILMQSREANLMEALPSASESLHIKNYLEGNIDGSKEEKETSDLIDKAIDIIYTRIVFEADDFNLVLDEECTCFLASQQKAKARLLDAILTIPDFLPLHWGGKVVRVGVFEDDENINRFAEAVVQKIQKKETKIRASNIVKMCKESEKHVKRSDSRESRDRKKLDRGRRVSREPFEAHHNAHGGVAAKRRVSNLENRKHSPAPHHSDPVKVSVIASRSAPELKTKK